MTKVALSPRSTYVGSGLCTWAKACIHRHTPAYTTRVFRSIKKDKFSAIMAEVWNESHIVLELFQTQFFPLYKVLYGTFSKYIEIPQEKA